MFAITIVHMKCTIYMLNKLFTSTIYVAFRLSCKELCEIFLNTFKPFIFHLKVDINDKNDCIFNAYSDISFQSFIYHKILFY